MPRLSPVIAGPSSSRLAATVSTSAPIKRSRKRSRHNLPYEGEDGEEHHHQQASSSSWIADDNSGSHDFQAWPQYDQEDDRRRSSSYGATSSTRHKTGHARDNESLYDVVARIATSIIEERQQEQQQQRRLHGARRRVLAGEGGEARGSRSNSGGGSDDNSSDSEASSSSSRRSGNGSGDAAQDTESDDDDEAEDERSAIASTSSAADTSSALIDPLVLSIQSGLETLLASLERRRQRQQEAQGSIGSKRRVSVMSGEDVLEALQTLVGDQHGRMRGLGGGRAEAVGGREVLEAVRERVERRRREMSGRDDAGLGEGEEEMGAAAATAEPEESGGHRGIEECEEERDGRGQDVTTTGSSQSQQNPPQHPADGNPAPAPRLRRPPSSKQPAAAATWFGDESVKSRKRRLDALLLLG